MDLKNVKNFYEIEQAGREIIQHQIWIKRSSQAKSSI